MASSLAFWLENPSPNPENSNDNEPLEPAKANDTIENDTNVELHFNYWLLETEGISYLDVGVRLSKISKFESLNIYLPFDYSKFKYKPELGRIVCGGEDLVSAIFNSPVIDKKPRINSTVYDFVLSDRPNNANLSFFTNLEKDQGNSHKGVIIEEFMDSENKGVTLKFPWDMFSFIDDYDGYFRFRVELSKEDKGLISKDYESKDAWLTNYFEKSEMVDFRVNESRNLPMRIRGMLAADSHIKKIHFFLIRDASSEYRMGHSDYERCRLLEDSLWKDYLGSAKAHNQMLIYHWKGKGSDGYSIDHFSSFAKFSKRDIKIRDLIAAIAIILILGVLSGLGANLLWNIGGKDIESSTIEARCRVAESKVLDLPVDKDMNSPAKIENNTHIDKINGGGQ